MLRVVCPKFIRKGVVDAKKLGDVGISDELFEKLRSKYNLKNKSHVYLIDDDKIGKIIQNWDRNKIRMKSDTNFANIDINIVFGMANKSSYYKAVYDRTNSNNKKVSREDLIKHLSVFLKMAESKQSIYEFIQNAEDARASKMLFWVLEKDNESWFIFANNGDKFSPSDIYSILMIAESEKSEEEIGKYGIGFKLIHRLVMKDGEDWEGLIDKLYGPVLFSWGKNEDIKKFIEWCKKPYPLDCEKSWEYPILFKFLITTFPVGYWEKIKRFPGEKRTPFTDEDIRIMQKIPEWFKEEIQNWEKGSLFIVPFRTKNKDEVIGRLGNLKGVLNFLKNLNTIIWGKNDESPKTVRKQQSLLDEKIDGFHFVFSSKKDEYTEEPNIYNPLPLDDERFGFNFLINSTKFDVQAHRTKLSNRDIMEEVFEKLRQRLEYIKNKDKVRYYEIYKSIITSKPKEETEEKKKVWEYFKNQLWDFLIQNIPVKDKNSQIVITSYGKVFLNETGFENSEIPLDRFFNDNYWLPEDFEDSLLTNTRWIELKSKKLEDIIRKNINEFNTWMKENIGKYDKILKEISEKISKSELGKDWITQLCIVKYQNNLYTINEAKNNHIIITVDKEENEGFKELAKVINNIKVADYNEHLSKILKETDNFKLKEDIVEIINDFAISNLVEKIKILGIIIKYFVVEGYPDWYSYKIETDRIGDIKLFKNSNGEIKPLSDLLPYDELPTGNFNLNDYPTLKEYVIDKEEWRAIKMYLKDNLDMLKGNMLSWEMLRKEFNGKFYHGKVEDRHYKVLEKITDIIPQDILRFEQKQKYKKLNLDEKILSASINKNSKLDLNEVKNLLDFLSKTEGKNFFNSYILEPVIESNYYKNKIKKRNNGDLQIFYNFKNETVEFLKKFNIYVIPIKEYQDFGGKVEDIFSKNYIGKIDIKMSEYISFNVIKPNNATIKLNNEIAKDLLKVYFENDNCKGLEFTINGKPSSDYKPLRVSNSLNYPKEINWDNVFSDKSKEAVEISKKLSEVIFGNENEYEKIKEKLFKEEEIKEIGSIKELVEKKNYQKTVDSLIALLWLYSKMKDKDIKKLVLGDGNNETHAIEGTELAELTDFVIKKEHWQGDWGKIIKFAEDNQNYFYDICLVEPYIYGDTLYHPPIKEDKKKEFIKMIYDKHKNDAHLFIKNNQNNHKNNCSVCNKDYTKYVYPDKLALNSEKIPDWLRVGNGEKFKRFLEGLGVRTPENDEVIEFRKLIFDKDKEVKL